MKCPKCGNETRVTDTRERGSRRIRRRLCGICNYPFRTTEVIGDPGEGAPLFNTRIRKKNGDIERFDKNKLTQSISVAIRKANRDNTLLETIVTKVEQNVLADLADTIESQIIGGYVMEELKRHDVIAYIRFASVHREMETVADFRRLLKELPPDE